MRVDRTPERRRDVQLVAQGAPAERAPRLVAFVVDGIEMSVAARRAEQVLVGADDDGRVGGFEADRAAEVLGERDREALERGHGLLRGSRGGAPASAWSS